MYSNVCSRITIDPSQFWKLIHKQTTTYSLVFPRFPLTRCLCFVKSLFIVYLPIYRVMIALGSPNAPWSYLPTNYPFAMQILVLPGIPIKLRFFPCSPPNPRSPMASVYSSVFMSLSCSLFSSSVLFLLFFPFLPPNSSRIPRCTFARDTLLFSFQPELSYNFGICRCENSNSLAFPFKLLLFLFYLHGRYRAHAKWNCTGEFSDAFSTLRLDLRGQPGERVFDI